MLAMLYTVRVGVCLLMHALMSHLCTEGTCVQVRKTHPGLIVVGTIMNRSRQADMCSHGMLQLPPEDGVSYIPLQLDVPLCDQAAFDVLLVKVTDFMRLDAATGLGAVQPELVEVRLHA
jgi:hypothetical protein